MPGTRIGFKIIPQIFNSIPIHQHELDLQTFKASILQPYDTWSITYFFIKKKKILFPLCQRFIYAIKYHIIIKYMHNYKNFWMSFKNVFNVLSWDRNKLFFSEKEMKTSKCKEGTHSSSSGSYPVTYFSNSKDINLKPIKTSSMTPSLKPGALKHTETQLHSNCASSYTAFSLGISLKY